MKDFIIKLFSKKIVIGSLTLKTSTVAIAATVALTLGGVGAVVSSQVFVKANSNNVVSTEPIEVVATEDFTIETEEKNQEPENQTEMQVENEDLKEEVKEEDTHAHTISTTIESKATCTQKGTAVDYCEECDYTYTFALPMVAHRVGDWVIETEPTETAEGLRSQYCMDCGKLMANEVIAVIPHNHNYIVTSSQGANCKDAGYVNYSCAICDSSYTEESSPTGHNYVEIIKEESTCENEGHIYRKCSDCGNIVEVATIEKLPHNYNAWETIKNVTCTEEGIESHSCLSCNKIETKTIAPTGHIKDESLVVVTKEPTCTEKGELQYNCSSCQEVISEEIKANGHKKTDWIVDFTPTCTTEGSKHIECTVCDETLNISSIEALGHDLELVGVKDSTCSEEGVEHYSCDRCSYEEDRAISLKGHNSSDWIVDLSETCLTNGKKHKECLDCYAKLEEKTILAHGHKYGDALVVSPTCTEEGSSTVTCAVCEYKEVTQIAPTGHNFSFVQKVNPTCEATGYDIYMCTNDCNKLDIRNEVPSYECSDYSSDWIVDTDSTCTTEGSKHKECTKCEKVLITDSISKKPHVFTEYVVTLPATEEAEGAETATCNHCDAIDTKTIAKVPHVHDYNTEINRTEATCVTDGFYTLECRCNGTLKVDITKLGHDYVLTGHVDENCIADGSNTYNCTRCNDAYTDVISAHGHSSGEWEVTKEATDLVDGEKVRKCTICHTILETQIISKLPHTCDFGAFLESQVATCTTDGYEVYQCKCGLTDTIVLEKTNHANHAWVTIKDATHTEMGLKQDTCHDCGYIINSENIPVIPHDCNYIVTETVNPTCTEAGHITSNCEVCGKTKTETYNATGHTESGFVVDTNATCNTDGSQHTSCAVCGITLKTEIISATGHNMSDFTTDVPATCTTDGTEKQSCSSCDYSETRSIPAFGHSYGDWIIDKEATETEVGEQHKECATCGDIITEDTPQLPPHVHSFGESARTDATCTVTGSVTYSCECGDSYSETLNKVSHTIGDFIVDKDATCTETGSKHKECSVCNTTTETETINALGHSYGEAVVVDATCEANGSSTITCTTCNHSENTVITATGHNYVEKEKVNATCEADGSISYECSNCKNTYSDSIVKLNHEYVTTSTILATCTKGGYDIETCKHCGNTKHVNETEATGHTEGEAVVVKEAKLGEAGMKEVHCTQCNVVLSSEEIPMLLTDGVDSVYYFEIKDANGKYVPQMAIGHYNPTEVQEMLTIFNNYRKSINMPELEMSNNYINKYTDLRAVESSYLWDHKRPSNLATEFSENIAMTTPDGKGNTYGPQMIFDAWLTSEGHKKNIDASRTNGLTSFSVFYKRFEVPNWTPEINLPQYVYEVYWVQTFY